ncbi:MAG TPA: YggU family protein [Legionellales bacterium]|nr:YggU family protein [Legionellales bacterium]
MARAVLKKHFFNEMLMSSQADNDWYKILTDGIELFLYIKPGSKRNEIIGLHAGKLKIKVNSPPQEGKANKELIKFLSSKCNIPRSRFILRKGENSRIKTLFIHCEPRQIFSALKKDLLNL